MEFKGSSLIESFLSLVVYLKRCYHNNEKYVEREDENEFGRKQCIF